MRIVALRRTVAAIVAAVFSVTPAVSDPAARATADASTREVPGLREPVRLVVDRWGVPHLYARNTDDVFLAQGYNAARDRLFQLDLWRRRGLGLLSEAFGPRYVDKDRASRLFLYRGDMQREWAAYGPGTRRSVTAFVRGVNAYVDWVNAHPEALPPEFRRLGHRPDRWQPEDVVRIRSHGLALNAYPEALRAGAMCAGGQSAARALVRLEPAHEPRVPDGLDPCDVPADVLDTYLLGITPVTFDGVAIKSAPPSAPGGSNAWALAPSRTATGRPILAGDPHRSTTAPALRYVAHLSAPGLDVIGAGEPALPGISMGHNGRAAFGLTVFAADQEDIQVYRLHPDDPGRYLYRDRWVPFTTVREEVPVAGSTPRQVDLTFSRHGPVLKVDAARNLAFGLRTAWSEPGTAPYLTGLDAMTARSFPEFAARIRRWAAPPENLIYADTSGAIGWVPGALVPRRTQHDGLLPVPGDGRYEWDGFHDGAELPRVSNPKSGFVASANEFSMPAGHPLRVGYEWEPAARKERIVDVLSGSTRHTPAEMARLQRDQVDEYARRIVAVLRGIPAGDDPDTAAALRHLRDYDGTASADSAGAALFEPWLSNHLGPAFLAKFVAPAVAARVPRADVRQVIDALERPDQWFGPDGATVRDQLVQQTLRAAYAEVRGRLGADPAAWRWGNLQNALFSNPLGDTVGPFPRGGSVTTVDASTYIRGAYRSLSGAAYRMVLDVGAWDESTFVSAPGQSGDPASPHYADLAAPWSSGTQVPLLYSPAAVARNTESVITLVPAASGRG
ncbi:penicillin amidase [Nonomuraea solani]|uniref:Penicillin amidase n=1 Tax=Nonomuraea solani TaxID=1144553 RepID=A0A1H6F4M6_9ACTN|nr:penicillin acylase family protein [Nonomuraea solani]SEH04046.1 penicillin amidase [Nonomuraea solani]